MSTSHGSNDGLNGQSSEDHVDHASHRHNQFQPGSTVFLCYPGYGVVGQAIEIEEFPTGCWLGVDISRTFAELTLLRPLEIHETAQSLLIHPM